MCCQSYGRIRKLDLDHGAHRTMLSVFSSFVICLCFACFVVVHIEYQGLGFSRILLVAETTYYCTRRDTLVIYGPMVLVDVRYVNKCTAHMSELEGIRSQWVK